MAYLEARPQYIVVFREASARNVNILSDTLEVSEAGGVSTRASCTVLEAKDGVYARVYSRLGVAAADLSEEELAKLRSSEEVQIIVPNEQRFLPPIIPVREEDEIHGEEVRSDPIMAYLQGMRDAINAVLRFHSTRDWGGSTTPLWTWPIGIESLVDRSFSWCLQLIGMSPNYNVATGEGVSVAILDTGIDLYHPDFRDRVKEGDNAMSFVPGEPVQDGNGHGTHCAGIVAGPRVSTGGRRYGVAPNISLLIGKVLDNTGSGYDDWILDGMDWAATEQGANIISMSLGSGRQLGQPYPAQYERVAERLLQAGVLVVAAAGNSSNRPFYTEPVENPAACPSIMAVAAIDRNRRVASFSCAQKDQIGTLDVSAPGVAVYSAWKDSGFRSISGTSMATPHIAGVAALYRERYPNLSAQALWNLFAAQSQWLGSPNDFGRGLVQVPRA